MDQQQQPCIKHKRKQCPQKSDVVHWITEVHFQKLETNDETICSVFVFKLMLHNTHTPSHPTDGMKDFELYKCNRAPSTCVPEVQTIL